MTLFRTKKYSFHWFLNKKNKTIWKNNTTIEQINLLSFHKTNNNKTNGNTKSYFIFILFFYICFHISNQED